MDISLEFYKVKIVENIVGYLIMYYEPSEIPRYAKESCLSLQLEPTIKTPGLLMEDVSSIMLSQTHKENYLGV